MTMKRILAATDFSPASDAALERAAVLARLHGAALEITHVIPAGLLAELRAWLAGTEQDPDASQDALGARLEADADRIAGLELPRPATRLAIGSPAVEIAARARELDADLVVIGAHGRHFLREALLGTTALAVLAECEAPVLVVRHAQSAPYARLLVGTDLSAASLEALRVAADLAPHAAIDLLHAYEDPYAASLFLGQAKPPVVEHYRELARTRAAAALDDCVASLGAWGARVKTRLEYGPAALRVQEAAEATGADLVVVGVRRRGALERAALGSVSTHIVLEVPTDVLLVRETAGAAAESVAVPTVT